MTTQQKAMALRALGDLSVKVRDDGSWYVNVYGAEIGGDGMLTSVTQSEESPYAAIDAAWEGHTALPVKLYVVINATSRDKRRHLRWNGYMWQDLPVDGAA